MKETDISPVEKMKNKGVFRKLTVLEQRRRHSSQVMTAVQLECHLRNLVREIRSGALDKLGEFQQFIQYAPTEMKDRLLMSFEGGGPDSRKGDPWSDPGDLG